MTPISFAYVTDPVPYHPPLTLDLPCDRAYLITANGRHHWAIRAARTRYWRDLTQLRARSLINTGAWPRLAAANIEITIDWPDHRRRDPANWAPTGKAIVDGLVDARLLPDDDHHHVTGPDMRLGHGHPAIHITITPRDPT